MPEQLRKEKTEKQNTFVLYTQTLSEPENDAISSFFMELNEHIALPHDEKMQILTDFENALLYYSSVGATLNAALARLGIKNLGAFYIRPPSLWFSLDDAAKIYPLSIKHGHMAMYRLSVTFKSEIVPELLQMALTFTIKRFPTFATTVKKQNRDVDRLYPRSDVPCRKIRYG